MMRFMDALYELQTAFHEDDDYLNAHSIAVAIDLWDAFNKPINPLIAAPRLRDALSANQVNDPEGAFGYEIALMTLNEHYPE